MYSNIFSSEIRQQNRTEQNRLPCQSRAKRIAEQLQDLFRLQNRTITKLISIMKQNYYKAYFIAKQNLAKFISVV